MAIYARNTFKDGYTDVLIIDWPKTKVSLTRLMIDTKKIYPWHLAADLSEPIPDEYDLMPGTKKTLTRKLKNKPVLKNIYGILYKRHEKKRIQREKNLLNDLFRNYDKSNVELNLLTKTGFNQSLVEMFPSSAINYFEHGLGDYFYVQGKSVKKFYCVFSTMFSRYLERHHKSSVFVHELTDPGTFAEVCGQVIASYDKTDELKKMLVPQGELAIILMENLEIYNVKNSFWTDYLDRCLSKIRHPENYTFLFKPHHLQPFATITIMKNYMEEKGLKAIFADNRQTMNVSAEVLFSLWKDQARFVFSLFSSSIYYISHLYKNEQTRFYHGYNFFKPYTTDAPIQFVKHFESLEPLVKEVFSANCEEI